MKGIFRYLNLKYCLIAASILLLPLMVLSFYGLYSNKFYLLKIDNYIIPVLSFVHLLYLYVLWFKLKNHEVPDPQMRNLEFSMYVISVVYLFKFLDTLLIVLSYTEYQDHIIPATFLPMGTLILSMQALLLLLTIYTFLLRKHAIGSYRFDNFNEHVDPW